MTERTRPPTLGAGEPITVAAYVTATINATVVGSGGLTTLGDGLLELTGDNNYAGGTTILAGTLNYSNLDNLGSGTITFDGGTLQYATGFTGSTDISTLTVTIASGGAIIDTAGNTVTFAYPIGNGGSGGLTVTNNSFGTRARSTLDGANTFTGVTTVGAYNETLILANPLALQYSTFDTSGLRHIEFRQHADRCHLRGAARSHRQPGLGQFEPVGRRPHGRRE